MGRRKAFRAAVHCPPQAVPAKIILGRLGILTTLLAWVTYVISTILRELANNPNAGFRFQFETVSYLVVVTFLTFSALMYLVARQGALYRFRDHPRVPRGVLDRHFAEATEGSRCWCRPMPKNPTSCGSPCGVPPCRSSRTSVVLLVDDPPSPCDPEVQAARRDQGAGRGDRRGVERPGRAVQWSPGISGAAPGRAAPSTMSPSWLC